MPVSRIAAPLKVYNFFSPNRTQRSFGMILIYYILAVFSIIACVYVFEFTLFFHTSSAQQLQRTDSARTSEKSSSYSFTLTGQSMNVTFNQTISLPTFPDYVKSISSNKTSKRIKLGLYAKAKYVADISDFESDSLLKSIPQHYPAIVVYYASWCGHCQMFVKVFEGIAQSVSKDSPLHVPIIFAALDCVAFPNACQKAGVQQYPLVRAFNIPSDKQSLVSPGVSIMKHSEIKNYLLTHRRSIVDVYLEQASLYNRGMPSESLLRVLPNKIFVTSTNQTTNNEGAIQHIRSLAWSSSSRDRLKDALTSLQYLLQVEVLINMTEADLLSLKDFLNILLKLPRHSNSTEIWSKLQIISDWMNATPPKLMLEGYKTKIDSIFSQSSDGLKWSVCASNSMKNSTLQSTGYPCGLWLLMHYMTVAVGLSESPRPVEVMIAIRNLIANLFGCDGCRRHFLSMYDDCLYGRCVNNFNADDLQIWLWRVHNAANIRIAKEGRGERPSEPIWPTQEQCSDCWAKEALLKVWFGLRGNPPDVHVTDENSPTYYRDKVLKYLKKSYWE